MPRFYPPGTRTAGLLAAYAERLPAVELNATFRRRPTRSAIRGWVAATPASFRFAVKAQRASAIRGLLGSPGETVAWLTESLAEFGERLGTVLYRVPAEVRRDGPWVGGDASLADARLRELLAAWPRSIPLVVEFQDASWHVDETFAALREARSVLCTTELPPEGDEGATGGRSGWAVAASSTAVVAGEPAPAVSQPIPAHDVEAPTIRKTGPFLYLRLRRHDYDVQALDAWAARLEPFLDAGDDVYVFFRHDAVGRAGELALALRSRLRGD